MTILSTNKIPLGLKGLALLLIGVGGLFLSMFVIYVATALGENAVNYGVTESNLLDYLTMDVANYLLPAIFALSSSFALFYQKKFARTLIIIYGCTALPAIQFIVAGHPIFLFGILGAVVIFYMWKPNVKAYFEFL